MKEYLKDRGCGFIEMIIVLLIIGAITYYMFLKPTKEDTRKAQEIVHDTEDKVKENLKLGELRTKIRVYRMEKGEYPESLDVIAKAETLQKPGTMRFGFGLVPVMDIARYNYDPDTGEVSLKR